MQREIARPLAEPTHEYLFCHVKRISRMKSSDEDLFSICG